MKINKCGGYYIYMHYYIYNLIYLDQINGKKINGYDIIYNNEE